MLSLEGSRRLSRKKTGTGVNSENYTSKMRRSNGNKKKFQTVLRLKPPL